MDENSRKKLCWNCEGSISVLAETCPYCRASMIPYADLSSSEGEGEEAQTGEQEQEEDEGTMMATTMALLMGGSFFFLFGCLLYFFANDGYFVLRWSDSYWFLYLFIALPMLYFGIQNLRNLKES